MLPMVAIGFLPDIFERTFAHFLDLVRHHHALALTLLAQLFKPLYKELKKQKYCLSV